ncbi:MAG: right-handed parallel beta-helix repeat-containing protein [Planctomycetota bacterium]
MLAREILCGLLFLTITSASVCRGDDFYVDALNGSDQTGDGSASSPWRTITHSLAQIGPGDLTTEHTLHVRPGVYDSSIGEVFPLRPGIHVSLQATSASSETLIRGDTGKDVLLFDKRIKDGKEQRVSGIQISGGLNGVVWSLVFTGVSSPLTLTNTTITKCSKAGVYLPPNTGFSPILVDGCKVSENGTGFLAKATLFAHFVDIFNSELTDNLSDGFYLLGDGYMQSSWEVNSTKISRNGGAGILLKSDHRSAMSGTLVNSTISHNARGGFEGRSYPRCYYIPYYGYRCYSGQIGPGRVHNNTIYGNGPPGGMTGNNPSYVDAASVSSIIWGNSPIDVGPGFQHAPYSNIETGGAFGSGTIHLPPDFVDGPGGDLRLRRTSPCIDLGAPFPSSYVPPTDIEGETRILDGGSGVARIDMGSDEFATFVAPTSPPVKGSPFQLFTQAPPAEEGLAVVVLFSGGKSTGSGIPLPGSGGRTVDLESDSIFGLGVGLLPLLQATIQGGQGVTTPVTIPAGLPFTGDVFYAGVSIDLAAGQYVSITPTHSFTVQ